MSSEINTVTHPLVTVITVVYNDKNNIENTVKSVLSQKRDCVEYVIIDGASTDGTTDIIRKYDNSVDFWISEKDGGIYDAMNKGVAAATGEWCLFMNSGDTFAVGEIIEEVSEILRTSIDLLYGNHIVDYGGHTRMVEAGSLDNLWKGMVFCHQSLFAKKSVLQACKFNDKYGTAADYGFIYSAYRNGYVFRYVNKPISIVKSGGVSDRYRFKSLYMQQKILCDNDGIRLKHLLYGMRRMTEELIKIPFKFLANIFRAISLRNRVKLIQ